MMTLTHELERLANAYLRHERVLDDVREWLLDHAQTVLDTPDPCLDRLDGELWRLISEYDRRDRDEQSFRAALASLMTSSDQPPPALPRSRSARTRSSPA